MKICIVTTSFPRWAGDHRGTFVFEAARAIQAQGVQVRVIALHNPGAQTRELMDSIEVIRPRYLWPERLEILQREGGGLPAMWRRHWGVRLALLPFLVIYTLTTAHYAQGFDLIHANWTLAGMMAWVSQFYHRRPVLVTVHGSDIVQATRLPLVRQLTQRMLKASAGIIAVSHALKEATAAQGISSQAIRVIPDGIDLKKFYPAPEKRAPLILYVGSLIKIKGVNYLIESMSQVARRFPEYRLVIIGEGPELQSLKSLGQKLEIANAIAFVGTQTPIQVRDWMQQASLLVLPSLEEGLGVVLLEALACGTPCVGTSVGGIPDVITPEVGVLVPPADPSALAEAMLGVLAEPERWALLSRNARRWVEQQFDWDIIAKKIIQVYEQVLSRPT